MSRERGVRYFHVFYESEPGKEEPPKMHDLKHGNECWCEPKCFRVSDAVIVIHDQADGLFVVEDYRANGGNPSPPAPPNASDPGP